MNEQQTIITILGSAGGAAKSVMAILNKSVIDSNDAIHSKLINSSIHLIDIKQKDLSYYKKLFPHLSKHIMLHQFDLNDTNRFMAHLAHTNTQIVIDVSWADTVDILRCCNQRGVKYVNSALENTMIDEHEELYEGFPLIERIQFFEQYKSQFKNTVAIIGSGMNPGVVQWMAIELLKQEAQPPLGCYIVEHDNSFLQDPTKAQKNTIYTTWSPECFLDEAIASYPMFMKNHTPLFLYEDVYNLEFKVTLGDKQFTGALMPHEEVYSLCKLFDMEGGFLYKINDHTINLIRSNLDDTDILWDFNMKVLDPLEMTLDGEDLVGVLFVYEDHERYMYNTLKNETIFSQYKTNATYFQVACGIYASLAVLLLDSIPNGVYYVDELLLKTTNQYGSYLTHYMKDFVIGENKKTDGLLLQRMKKR